MFTDMNLLMPKKALVISEDLMFWGPNTRKSVLAERNSWGGPTLIADVSELQSWALTNGVQWSVWLDNVDKGREPAWNCAVQPKNNGWVSVKSDGTNGTTKRWSRRLVQVSSSLSTQVSGKGATPQGDGWLGSDWAIRFDGFTIAMGHRTTSRTCDRLWPCQGLMWNTAGCCNTYLGQYSLPWKSWKDMTNVYPQFGLDVETSWCFTVAGALTV
jgi:hypothetical protein